MTTETPELPTGKTCYDCNGFEYTSPHFTPDQMYEFRRQGVAEARAHADRVLRSSVPDRHKGCTSPVGAVQSYIVELEEALAGHEGAADTLNAIANLFGIGSEARTTSVILENVRNSIRRSCCLGAIERRFFTVDAPDEDGDDEPSSECLLNWGHEPDAYAERFGEVLSERAANPAAQPAPAWDTCVFQGQPPEGFASWQAWAAAPVKTGVTVRATAGAPAPAQGVAKAQTGALETLAVIAKYLGIDEHTEKARPDYDGAAPVSHIFLAAIERRVAEALAGREGAVPADRAELAAECKRLAGGLVSHVQMEAIALTTRFRAGAKANRETANAQLHAAIDRLAALSAPAPAQGEREAFEATVKETGIDEADLQTLMELAAKVAGLADRHVRADPGYGMGPCDKGGPLWNPRYDNADAFALLVKMKSDLSFSDFEFAGRKWVEIWCRDEMVQTSGDLEDATRLVILRDAASMGKGTP